MFRMQSDCDVVPVAGPAAFNIQQLICTLARNSCASNGTPDSSVMCLCTVVIALDERERIHCQFQGANVFSITYACVHCRHCICTSPHHRAHVARLGCRMKWWLASKRALLATCGFVEENGIDKTRNDLMTQRVLVPGESHVTGSQHACTMIK